MLISFRSTKHRASAIYGLSTGFGPLLSFKASLDANAQGVGLLNHLRAGQGELLAPAVTRAMLLARVWSLAQGHSGASVEVLDALSAVLSVPWSPAVPELGSVGASGDLAPLAHAAGALCGEGDAFLGLERLSAVAALERVGLRPVKLQGRDALALVNGTSLTAAAAALAASTARRAISVALGLSALLVETLGAAVDFTSPALLALSGHRSAHRVALQLEEMLRGATAKPGRPLQEAYSVRCVPQLVGAAEETVAHVEQVVVADLNGVSDNPVFFPEEGRVVHGGNFFGQQVAFAADALNLALTQLANLAERQLDLLLDPGRSGGLPAAPFVEAGCSIWPRRRQPRGHRNRRLNASQRDTSQHPESSHQRTQSGRGSLRNAGGARGLQAERAARPGPSLAGVGAQAGGPPGGAGAHLCGRPRALGEAQRVRGTGRPGPAPGGGRSAPGPDSARAAKLGDGV